MDSSRQTRGRRPLSPCVEGIAFDAKRCAGRNATGLARLLRQSQYACDRRAKPGGVPGGGRPQPDDSPGAPDRVSSTRCGSGTAGAGQRSLSSWRAALLPLLTKAMPSSQGEAKRGPMLRCLDDLQGHRLPAGHRRAHCGPARARAGGAALRDHHHHRSWVPAPSCPGSPSGRWGSATRRCAFPCCAG